jgi:aspartate dehydrogenase
MTKGGSTTRKVGVVGLGAIGQALARAIDDGTIAMELVAASELDETKAVAFLNTLKRPPALVALEELIARSELVIEATTQAALQTIVPKTLARGKDLMVLSVGGLLGRAHWFQLAEEKGCHIYIPSGAIAGLDGVRAACQGAVGSVTLITRKPPQAFAGVAYVAERGIDLNALPEETVLFEGAARDACAAFPANVNVAATLSLAGIGAERTHVKIVAVPGSASNVHQIEVVGEFGKLAVEVENVPSEANPRTSKLAYLSAFATLQAIAAGTKVGT